MVPEVTVREIATREYLGVSESDSVADAVDLMLEESAPGVVVLRGTDPVGMLTAEDALAFVPGDEDPRETDVAVAMSGTVPTVPADTPVVEAAGVMADAGVGSVLATEDGEVLGLVSERDVVRTTSTLADRASLDDRGSPSDRTAPTEVADAASGAASAEPGDAAAGNAEADHATQGVCELCGSLTPDLQGFNGQLVCADCRDV